MARQRDYRAEYQRRQAAAQRAGWPSYWQQRQTMRQADEYTGASRRQFIATVKDPAGDLSPAQARSLWAEGTEAMHDGDIERAREIAIELGYRPAKDTYPPESAFWYH